MKSESCSREGAPSPIHIGILGSCISRDSVEYLDASQVNITHYAARHSLASHESDASEYFPRDPEVDSPFQERIMREDFSGTAVSTLLEKSQDAHLLLWDLADERGGLYELPEIEGTDSSPLFVTRSFDTERNNSVKTVLASARPIPFGTDEHFALWAPAAERVATAITNANLMDRTVVIEAQWALVSSTVTPTGPSFGYMPAEANMLYERYYRHLDTLGVTIVEPDPDTLIADPEHVWGFAPFHYVPEFYESVLSRIESATGMALPRA